MNTSKMNEVVNRFKKRITKELDLNAKNSDFEFACLNDTHWYFQFTVQDGLYKGQKHIVEFKLVYGQDPDIYAYPLNGPMCTFETPIWHPNISDKGTICLDVLTDNWSPSMFTASIINALKILLQTPDPLSPQNAAAAKIMIDEPADHHIKKIKDFYDYDKAPENIRKLFM
jgi:ubiquitin-protein ligase